MSRWRSTLDQLMRERGRAIYGYAYVLTGDRVEAEDLMQDALVRAFRSGRRASSLDAAHVYVKRAIATAFIDGGRRAAARPRSALGELHEWSASLPASEDHAPRIASAIDLQSALLTLPPRERACVSLRYLDDMTIGGVADTLGLAPGTVKRYLHDGIARLREALPDMDLSDPELATVEVRHGGEE